MAKIVMGLGSSHGPMLSTPPEEWGQRVLAYWTLMTLGPLLVGMSLTLSTYLDTAARRAGLDPQALMQFASGWPHLLARLVPTHGDHSLGAQLGRRQHPA